MQFKKITVIAAALLVTVSLAGCGSDSDDQAKETPVASSTAEPSTSTTDAKDEESEAESDDVAESAGETFEEPSAFQAEDGDQVGGLCGTTDAGDEVTAGEGVPCSVATQIYDHLFEASYEPWSASPDMQAAPLTNFRISDPVSGEDHDVYCLVSPDSSSVNCSSGLEGVSKVYLSVRSDSAASPIGNRLPIN